MSTDDGIFVATENDTETKDTEKTTNPESPLKRFAQGLGRTILVFGLGFAMVGGIFFGLRTLDYSVKAHDYERSEISQLDYALTQDRTNITYYVNGEENGVYFCEQVKGGLTECLNSDHTVKLTHSRTRGDNFYRPELEIVGTDVRYRLMCNQDKDGRYCVPSEYSI